MVPSYMFSQGYNVLGQIETKRANGAVLNFDLRDSVTFKRKSNQKPGYYVMYPY
jgi:hypothetical protein